MDFNTQQPGEMVKRYLRVIAATVLVAFMGIVGGRLLDNFLGSRTAVWALVQIGLVGVFSGLVREALYALKFSPEEISLGTSVFASSVFSSQSSLIPRIATLLPGGTSNTMFGGYY